jgi:CheY-like chemotaxis protein
MGRRILHDAGYEVVTVNNGSAALKKISEHKPEIIILDVYMPGYSGLEVCQRLKQSADTSQVPVLLTVGKLEPFKAEEAKRVHADAFIIKPFEATELLTALTKLEDKIVPEPPLSKRGRFFKSSAAQKGTAVAGDGASDSSDTSWKNRLRIPSAKKSAEVEPEPEAAPVSRATFRDLREESQPAGPLPEDVTPEEIAAIAAAASALDQGHAPNSEVAAFAVTEEPAAELPPPTFSPITDFEAPVEPVLKESESTPQEFEASPAPQPEAATEPVTIEDSATPTESFEAAPVAEAAPEQTPASEIQPEPEPTSEPSREVVAQFTEFDVDTALASLEPTNGDGLVAGSFLSGRVPENGAPVAQISQEATVSGWMAQEVPLAEGEASLILEREMEKVYATLGRDTGASLAAAEEEAAHLAESTVSAMASELPVPTDLPASPELAYSVDTASSANQDLVPDVAASAADSPQELVADAIANVTELVASGQVQDEPAVEAPSSEAIAAESEPAAFAAAASVGYGTPEITPPEMPSPLPAQAPPVEEEQEADLAAAWARWRQIRETVVSPELTSQIAEVATSEFRDIKREQQSNSQPEPESATPSTPADQAVISSIVESVLAELKPKLVEEIAKKLGKKD